MIIVFPPLAGDLSKDGRFLTPLSCTITEDANGPYELEIEHLRDEAERFRALVCGAVIRAPAPPKRTALKRLTTGTVDIYRAVGTAYTEIEIVHLPWPNDESFYEVKKTKYTSVPVTNAPGGATIGRVAHGERLTLVATGSGYHNVITRGGVNGYVKTSQAAFYATEETAPSVVSDSGEVGGEQLFRVYRVEVESPDRVRAYARHITYDAAAHKIRELVAENTPLANLLGTLSVNGIHFYTTLTDTISQTYSDKTAMEIVMELCDELDAQLVRDNHDAYLLPAGTSELTARMAVGKNITAMSCETSWDSLVTRFIPVIEGVEGTAIDSPRISDYPYPYVEHIEAETTEEAQEEAEKRLAAGCDLPEVTVDIAYAENETVEALRPVTDLLLDSGGTPLWTLLEEALVTDGGTESILLPRVGDLALFDRIQAEDRGMGVTVDAQIVALEFDSLRRRVLGITIGKARSRLTGSIFTSPTGTWQN